MAYKAVMKPTEGTILTVAREMGEFAMANYASYDSQESFLTDVINHGKNTLGKNAGNASGAKKKRAWLMLVDKALFAS